MKLRVVGRATPCPPPQDCRKRTQLRRPRRNHCGCSGPSLRNQTITHRPRGGAHAVARPTGLGRPSGPWAQLAAFCGRWFQSAIRTRRFGGQVIARLALAVIGFSMISTHVRAAASETVPKLVTRWVENPSETNRVTVEVSGFNLAMLRDLEKPGRTFQQWAEILSVFVVGNDLPSPMFGTYVVTNATLRFEPRFPLGRGVRYGDGCDGRCRRRAWARRNGGRISAGSPEAPRRWDRLG